jgi:hypothetical protein
VTRRRRKKADCRVHLVNECPRIGSGQRGVTVVTLGRKWVRIRETATGRSGRIDRRTWDAMPKH